MVSPSVRGLEASALSLSAAGEVGMGSGEEGGGRLCFQCQQKPQGKLSPAVAQADTPREGLSDHLLSSSSDAASSSLGLQLGVAVSPVPHLSSSTRSKVEVWGTSQGDGVPQHSAMAPWQWQEAVEVGHS